MKSILDELEIKGEGKEYYPHIIIGVDCTEDGKLLSSKIITDGNAITLLGLQSYLESLLNVVNDKIYDALSNTVMSTEQSKLIDDINKAYDLLLKSNSPMVDVILKKYESLTLSEMSIEVLTGILNEINSHIPNEEDISLKD